MYVELSSEVLGVTVLAIRGTDVGRLHDFMEDIKMFTEPVLFTMLSGVFPTIRLWSQDTTSETFAHVVYALLNDLLYQITDGLNNQRAPFSLLDEIKSHIDSHYHTDISRESVAETFNISPGYLSRLFSKESDVKFNEYLKLARISRSKTLLTNTNLKINEVSEKCGFTDTNYFCKVFRDINDCTPLEYRRKNKGARS